MTLYYLYWVEVVLIFIGLWFYLRQYLTDEQDRKMTEAERRIGESLRQEKQQ